MFSGRTKQPCPTCGALETVVPIVYGAPRWDMVRDAREGLIHMPGREESPGCPWWYCTTCELEFGPDEASEDGQATQ